jgi:hypothetical protein
MAPKHKHSDAGNLDMPKGAVKYFLEGKGESSRLKEKHYMQRFLRSMVRTNLSYCEGERKITLVSLSNCKNYGHNG